MSDFDKGIYSEAEARICLSCSAKKCRGICDRLRDEKARLHRESLPTPLFELDTSAEEPVSPTAADEPSEFDIPNAPLWPKKNPYINNG